MTNLCFEEWRFKNKKRFYLSQPEYPIRNKAFWTLCTRISLSWDSPESVPVSLGILQGEKNKGHSLIQMLWDSSRLGYMFQWPTAANQIFSSARIQQHVYLKLKWVCKQHCTWLLHIISCSDSHFSFGVSLLYRYPFIHPVLWLNINYFKGF